MHGHAHPSLEFVSDMRNSSEIIARDFGRGFDGRDGSIGRDEAELGSGQVWRGGVSEG